MNREELEGKIATLTGGRAAEDLVFGTCTTGASNDIEQATKLARSMVTQYGMSKRFGMVQMEVQRNQYLSGDSSLACSEETASCIDHEVIAIVREAKDSADCILVENLGALHELAQYLLERESITGEEFMAVLNRADSPTENH